MRRCLLPAALLLAAATGSAHAMGDEFKTPSNNIDCYYLPDTATLVCTRYKPDVQTVFLSNDDEPNVGPPETDATHAPAGIPVLAYGKSWKRGSFSCRSEKSGLTCKSARHGFSMSRAAINYY